MAGRQVEVSRWIWVPAFAAVSTSAVALWAYLSRQPVNPWAYLFLFTLNCLALHVGGVGVMRITLRSRAEHKAAPVAQFLETVREYVANEPAEPAEPAGHR